MVAFLTFIVPATGASDRVLKTREHRQVRSLHRHLGTLAFFRHRPRLGRTVVGRREVRRSRIWVAVIRRELAETRAQLRPPWAVPGWWLTQAMCIHRYESGDWHQRGTYSGGLQFLDSTWASVGGSGRAADHSPAEQLWRAYRVWQRDGGRWSEWGTASRCGLA